MPVGDSGGFLLSLVTESFAARALLGSLAAASLAAVLVGFGFVHTSRARRLVLLAPVLTAAGAAVASFGEVYLPLQLWVTTGAGTAAGTLLDVFGEPLGITARGIDLLVVAYGAVVAVLVGRRLLGVLAVRRALRPAVPAPAHHPIACMPRRMANRMGLRSPTVLLLDDCPGGAFAFGGVRRGVIAVDPEVVTELDGHELEGLVAHELAHLARHDTHLGALVGVFRDVAFFLVPLHVAARWLRREQEESADELASRHTGRPVALASSILKVWDHSRGRRQLGHVCGAVPGRLAVPSGVLAGPNEAQRAVALLTARIERLIADLPTPTRLRRHAEVGIAVAVLAAGTSAALTVPAWIATDFKADSLSFLVLSAPAETEVEAPAFATFRALAPAVAATSSGAPLDEHQPALPPPSASCTCVETQAELAAGVAAIGPPASQRLGWGSPDRHAWEVRRPEDDGPMQTARPLWTLSDSQTQLGFFVVSGPTP
jgi:Zn-dependent protease with chaperone function